MTSAQRILIAEADASLRETMIELLSASGHLVVGAHTANAMERQIVESLARAERFDLLLADLDLPGSCTLDTLERLGVANVRPRTIVLSARSDDATLVEIYRIGCLCALTKPFDMRDLLLVVEMVVPGTVHGRGA